MAKAIWGTKRTCYNCGARFYDLCRDPIACPTCGTIFDPERQPRQRRGGAGGRDQAAAVSAIDQKVSAKKIVDDDGLDDADDVKEADDDDADDADEEELEEMTSKDGELIEDTSELGEDDDDIGEVMEHVEGDSDERP